MEPLRVLHVFGGLDSGGAESRTMDIYRKLDKDKVQFDFLIHTNKKGFFEDEILNMGGRIHRVPRLSFKTIFAYSNAVKNFFNSHPEYKIVHGHMLSTAFIYLKIAKSKGVPVRIAHSRSGSRAQKDVVAKIKNFTDKLSRLHATHLFAVSKLAGYGAFNKKRVESGEVKIIPNAIDSKRYNFNENKRNEIREKLGLNNNLVIGHIGRFSPQKNHLFILNVFTEIQKNQPKSKLVLIGDGPMQSQIKEKITALDLEDSAFLLGVREDVQDLLQAMDVLLFPSTHEGLPGVVLEAQAAGLPSVISDTITDEVKITDLVKYISLTMEKDDWAKEVINMVMETERENTHESIVKVGYDIASVAKWYESFYLDSINKVTK